MPLLNLKETPLMLIVLIGKIERELVDVVLNFVGLNQVLI